MNALKFIRPSHKNKSVVCSIMCLIRFVLPTSQASLASVDVIPLFINSSADLSIEDEDIQVSYPSYCEGNPQMSRASSAVHIHHIPTGVEVQSTGISIIKLIITDEFLKWYEMIRLVHSQVRGVSLPTRSKPSTV